MSALRDVMLANRTDPADWTSDQLSEGISAALKDRDFLAVQGFMTLMAVRDPDRAGLLYDLLTLP